MIIITITYFAFVVASTPPRSPLTLWLPHELKLVASSNAGIYDICHETLLVKQLAKTRGLYVRFVRNGCFRIF